MRDNKETIIGLVFGSIFFVALANEFVISYSEIKYEEVTWSYFLIISALFGASMLFVGLYLIIALLIIFMIFLEKRENKIVDKYKKWKEEKNDKTNND